MKIQTAFLIIFIEYILFAYLSFIVLNDTIYSIKVFIGYAMGILFFRELFIILIYCIISLLTLFLCKSVYSTKVEILEGLLLLLIFIIFGSKILGKYGLLIESVIIIVPILLNNYSEIKRLLR